MPLIINTNVTALNAQRHLAVNTHGLNKSMEKLASGYRINRAGDDAAGLQLSENLRAQIRGSKMALNNVQDGINMVNVVDGVFSQLQGILQRMRELLVQGANDTYSTAARQAINQENAQLISEFDRIVTSTQWNGRPLFQGNFRIYFQVGPNGDINNDTILAHRSTSPPVGYPLMGPFTLSLLGVTTNNFNITTNLRARQLISQVDNALNIVNYRRGLAGALINRLEGTANNLMTSIENLSASESRIRNVDVAAETASLARNQVLQQASSSILAQANQTPSLALKLLQS